MQVTQRIYVAKDWVRNANNGLTAEIQNWHEVEKALGAVNHEKTQLAEKLKIAENRRRSAEAGLKSAEAQAEDQRKELYITQLNLATEKATILDLQSKLQKAEEALKVAQEAVTAAEISTYERGVLETEARLIAKVTAVCREYCAETYNHALDWAGVPADSDLRRVDNVYYPEDLRENPTLPPLPADLPFPPPKQLILSQKPSQDVEVPVGIDKEKSGAVVVSQLEVKTKEKDKGKGKAQNKADAKPSEDTLTIGDVVSKAKIAESKSKIDSKKDSHQSQT